jgi:ribosomal protein S18 acetylase RimI-like enzyme
VGSSVGCGPMSATQITSIGVGQLSELEPLWRSLHQHHRSVADLPVLVDDDLSWQRRRDWYETRLDAGDAFALLARRGEVPVGYALVYIRPGDDDTWPVGDHLAELVSLAVAPEARGQGVGTALMDAVDAELERRGVRDLEVAVMAGNDRALRFYERRGLRAGEVLLFRFGG